MDKLKKILDKIKQNSYEYCIHALGCRVIQKVIECFPSDLIYDVVYKEIYDHLDTLSEDKYGNYVIQHLLTYGDKKNKNKVIQIVKNNIFNLCNQK